MEQETRIVKANQLTSVFRELKLQQDRLARRKGQQQRAVGNVDLTS